MRLSLLIPVFLVFGLTLPSNAQKIRSADTGAVDLVLLGSEGLSDEPVTVKSGESLWSEEFQPLYMKQLVDSVEKRIRPNTPGVAAGTVLIGVRLASGIAYCPAIDYDAPTTKVQCFQDLNDDQEFDGGYYTDQRGFDTQFLSGWLRGLAGLSPKISYANLAEGAEIPTGRLTVQYDRIKKNAPQFWLYVEQERADNRATCELTEQGTCILLGREFRFSVNDDKTVTFTPVAQAENRLFTFYSASSYRR